MSKNISFTKKARLTLLIAFSLSLFVLVELIYISSTKSMNDDMLSKKRTFVSVIGLPDLAISSQDSFVRHRSISDTFSIYANDGTLREYSNTTFAISHKEIN